MNTSHPTATFDEWLDGMRAHIAEIRASLLEAAAALEGQPPALDPRGSCMQCTVGKDGECVHCYAKAGESCKYVEGVDATVEAAREEADFQARFGGEIYDAACNGSDGRWGEAVRSGWMARAARETAAVRTLTRLGYTYTGGVEWRPPVGPRPAFVEPGTVLRGRTIAELDEIARSAQVAFCLGKFTSFEVAFARGIEAALGIGVPS